MTLILVTIPLYMLYEVSIRVVKWIEPKASEKEIASKSVLTGDETH